MSVLPHLRSGGAGARGGGLPPAAARLLPLAGSDLPSLQSGGPWVANHRGTGPPERDGRRGPPVAGHRLGSGSPKRRTTPGGRAAHRVLRGHPGGRVPVSPRSALPGRVRGDVGGRYRPPVDASYCQCGSGSGGRPPRARPPTPRGRGDGGSGRPWLSVSLRRTSPNARPLGRSRGGAACDNRQPGISLFRTRSVGPIPGGRGAVLLGPIPGGRGLALSGARHRRTQRGGPCGPAGPADPPRHTPRPWLSVPRTGGIRGGERRRPGYSPARSDPGRPGSPSLGARRRTGSEGQCGPSGRASRPPRPPS